MLDSRDFSWKLAHSNRHARRHTFPLSLGLPTKGPPCGFACTTSSKQGRQSNKPPELQNSVIPLKTYGSHGILTVCPSPAAFAIGLGPTNPPMIVIAEEPSGFRRSGFSPDLRLLVPTFSLPCAPLRLTAGASLHKKCSSTTHGLH